MFPKKCKTRRRWFRTHAGPRASWPCWPWKVSCSCPSGSTWFPFNQHKGWTVLIAIATVGAALLLMFLWFLAALLFRLRFQFSILSLLVLTRGRRHPVQLAGGGEETGEETAGGGGGDREGRWVGSL